MCYRPQESPGNSAKGEHSHQNANDDQAHLEGMRGPLGKTWQLVSLQMLLLSLTLGHRST